ncbi:hypothetical protein MPRF_02370 [Mycolicibacterium parafortuitum]|uniref:Rieske domain-containing protein n=1 Tax=Mycolicibacterium parafortuitum TaxID=39692 RepID=A0A7I7TVZ7_MYCPF|nr:Rieske 2Fe-2S domain-containing protein [Mycolicibacterium parafortuitum]PQE00611.1 hypothetical protein CYL16_11550 [Mycobacterium sp. EPG1]BBY73338.1 hypothetical protein MPRF_02370 [Mycolicibacterium parafortuitum]
MTAEWVAVGTTTELARRRKMRVEVEGRAIVLFHAAGRVYAFDDLCVHQDRSLFKGTLLGDKVICPGHQWQFDLDTGYEESQDRCQPTFAVRVDADTIYIDPVPRTVAALPTGSDERETQ